MNVKILYRYTRADGGTTVSTKEPNCPYSVEYRIIADEGKLLVKEGYEPTPCIDTETVYGWNEIEDKREEAETEALTNGEQDFN